jgi:hypothetical protein
MNLSYYICLVLDFIYIPAIYYLSKTYGVIDVALFFTMWRMVGIAHRNHVKSQIKKMTTIEQKEFWNSRSITDLVVALILGGPSVWYALTHHYD